MQKRKNRKQLKHVYVLKLKHSSQYETINGLALSPRQWKTLHRSRSLYEASTRFQFYHFT